jgi:hypothetical protein
MKPSRLFWRAYLSDEMRGVLSNDALILSLVQEMREAGCGRDDDTVVVERIRKLLSGTAIDYMRKRLVREQVL